MKTITSAAMIRPESAGKISVAQGDALAFPDMKKAMTDSEVIDVDLDEPPPAATDAGRTDQEQAIQAVAEALDEFGLQEDVGQVLLLVLAQVAGARDRRGDDPGVARLAPLLRRRHLGRRKWRG